MQEPRLKTRITDIPVANERIYIEISKHLKVPKKEVEEIVSFIGNYVSGVIEEGRMEAIMLPYFGKFKPKLRHIRAIQKQVQGNLNGRNTIFHAITRGQVPKEVVKEQPGKRTKPSVNPIKSQETGSQQSTNTE